MTRGVRKAQRHLQRIREVIAKRKSPFCNAREEEVIEKIRKDRENIWEEKLAARS